ncbi:hypothetical protein J4573_38290 [Actinomadura barringtoniae]|uniref:Uncharacterized protein n=1 Tax=Actinomadura barringtoniae TaxID=1427535 RepID=A0A939T8C6_9ACTN|nr:hypothetical protein [Actinomadura barringtoniae]MBO2452994.1 hypothetical protein [Actinomadura barringtoniae]
MPDWGELRVLDDRHLRVAVWPADPTALDLDHEVPAMLVASAPTGVYSVDIKARRLENAAMVWAHYELTITSARLVDRGTTPRPPNRIIEAEVIETEVLTHEPSRKWREGKFSLR